MSEIRTIRYRLHPGYKTKADLLSGTAGACRFVRNHFIGELQKEYKETGKCDYRHYSLCNAFTKLRDSGEIGWLTEYSSYNLRASLKSIDIAYKEFFKGTGGLPKFHGKYSRDPSFPLGSYQAFKIVNNSIRIQRIGWMKISGNNLYPNAVAKSGTVKREGGKWYVYIAYKVSDDELPFRNNDGEMVGIDRNVAKNGIATSDGVVHISPDLDKLKMLECRKKRYQRMMARRVKGSNRRGKAKRMFRKTCNKIACVKKNWSHKLSREVTNDFTVAVIEELNTKGMMKSAKGTVENPGKGVAQKRGLNRSIAGSNWYQLEQMLAYKMGEDNVVKVPAPYTSQTCHKCGYVHEDNRKTQADFICGECDYTGNADINAALNILASGIGAIGRVDRDTPLKNCTAGKVVYNASMNSLLPTMATGI